MDLTFASIMAYIEYFDRHSGLKSPSLEGDVPSLEAYALFHLVLKQPMCNMNRSRMTHVYI